MELSGTLTTVASIFLLLAVGYAAKRTGALKASDATVVNSIVINLTMPAFIFIYTHRKPLTTPMVKAVGFGIAMEMVVLAAAYLAARALKLDRRTTGALMLVSAFGNTGFLGYPVVTAAFPGDKHAILTAVLLDNFMMALALNTIGVVVATSFAGAKFEWASIVQFFKTPLFPATVLALALKDVYVPPLIMQTLVYLAAGTVPLAMISTGLAISAGAVRRYPVAIAVGLALKMGLLPLLIYAWLPVIGASGTVRTVIVLECAVPSAVMSGVIAAKFGANGAFAAGAVFLSTLASLVVIPAVLVLVG